MVLLFWFLLPTVGAGIDRATHIPQERIDTKMNNAVGEYHPDAVPNSNSSGISDFNKSGNQIRQEYAKVRTMPNTKILHSNANVFYRNNDVYGFRVFNNTRSNSFCC